MKFSKLKEEKALIAYIFAWCGHNAHWVWTKKKSKVKSSGVFKFKSGRFSGLSVEEVSKKEGGDRYLMFLFCRSRTRTELRRRYRSTITCAVGGRRRYH